MHNHGHVFCGADASLGRDDMGRVHYGKYLRCTLNRESAEQECLEGLKRSVLAGYVVMITILLAVGGLIWVAFQF